MAAVQATNWLVVTGLLFALYGAVMLAGAIYGSASWSVNDGERAFSAAERQKVTAWYAGILLAAGFGLQTLGQFTASGLTALVPVMLIALIAYLFAYLLAIDAAGNRPMTALGARANLGGQSVAVVNEPGRKADDVVEAGAAAMKLRVAV